MIKPVTKDFGLKFCPYSSSVGMWYTLPQL